MDSECETIDFKDIYAVWVVIEIDTQLISEVLYEFKIIHFELYTAPRDY